MTLVSFTGEEVWHMDSELQYLVQMCVGVQMCYSLSVGVCQSNKQNHLKPSALLMGEHGASRCFDSNLWNYGHLCVCVCVYVCLCVCLVGSDGSICLYCFSPWLLCLQQTCIVGLFYFGTHTHINIPARRLCAHTPTQNWVLYLVHYVHRCVFGTKDTNRKLMKGK